MSDLDKKYLNVVLVVVVVVVEVVFGVNVVVVYIIQILYHGYNYLDTDLKVVLLCVRQAIGNVNHVLLTRITSLAVKSRYRKDV